MNSPYKVFSTSGINGQLVNRLMEIQELAYAINLQGRYRVGTTLTIDGHTLLVSAAQPMEGGSQLPWGIFRNMAAALPSASSDQQQHSIALEDLNEITRALRHYLDQPSSN